MVVSQEKFLSQCVEDIFSNKMKYGVLSGPSFAEEIMKNYPTFVVVASKDEKVCNL